MSAKLVDLDQVRKQRQRRLMLEAAAAHDLVLASLLAQKSPILGDIFGTPSGTVNDRRRPQPPKGDP
jgi:hypothetical protein